MSEIKKNNFHNNKHTHRPSQPRAKITSRGLALQVLNRVLKDGGYTNIVLNQLLAKSALSDLDRRFATELVYGTVKALGTLDWILEHFLTRSLDSLDPEIRDLLRLGVFQIYYLDRVPVSAAVNESVNLAKAFTHKGGVGFVNGVLRNSVRRRDLIRQELEETSGLEQLRLKEFHPLWLLHRWQKQFGLEETQKLCAFDNRPAPLVLRVNTFRTTREKLVADLTAAGFAVSPSAWSVDGIVCSSLPSLKILFERFGSQIYIQDESSMLAAGILAPKPGSVLLDVCSAPGGKATHGAALMENKGRVIAADIYPHKLQLIQENAKRLGLTCVETVLQDGTKLKPEWQGGADYVLVDAPCSGLGVLRRRAEARWTKTEADLASFPPLQRKILENAAAYTAPAGCLLYSTCTLEPAENHDLTAGFLRDHPEWERVGFKHPLTGERVEELQLYPQHDGIDGFYLALLARKGDKKQ